MADNLTYGVVVSGEFVSNRMERRVPSRVPDGVYSIDMGQDDFMATLKPADISLAVAWFRKASKVRVVRGVSFHDCVVPENPVSFRELPIKVAGATFDEFEEVEVAILRDRVCFFLQTVSTEKAYPLMDLAQAMASKASPSGIKGLTPEMKIVCAYHLIERKRKEEEEPVAVIKARMAEAGAEVRSVKKTNTGFEVVWHWDGVTVNTLLDKDYRVREAGYCVTGHDRTQSVRSVVNLIKTYREEGSAIHIMRSVD